MKRYLTGSLLTVAWQGVDILLNDLLTQDIRIVPLVIVFVAIFGISAWEMQLLTRKTGNLRDFTKDYLPFLIQTVCILAADILLYTALPLIRLIIFAVMEGCCALTIFLIGAATTAIYRKL